MRQAGSSSRNARAGYSRGKCSSFQTFWAGRLIEEAAGETCSRRWAGAAFGPHRADEHAEEMERPRNLPAAEMPARRPAPVVRGKAVTRPGRSCEPLPRSIAAGTPHSASAYCGVKRAYSALRQAMKSSKVARRFGDALFSRYISQFTQRRRNSRSYSPSFEDHAGHGQRAPPPRCRGGSASSNPPSTPCWKAASPSPPAWRRTACPR